MGTGTAPMVAIMAKIPMLGCGAPEPPRPGGSSPRKICCIFVNLLLYLREHARLDTTGAIHLTLRSVLGRSLSCNLSARVSSELLVEK